MFNSKIVKEAHKMTRKIIAEYPEVDYRTQFGLCLSYLLNKEEEKVVTWETIVTACENAVEDLGMTDYYVNEWKKGEHDRAYIEFRWYRKGRCKQVIKAGYWDNIKKEYVPYSKYVKQYDVLNKKYV